MKEECANAMIMLQPLLYGYAFNMPAEVLFHVQCCSIQGTRGFSIVVLPLNAWFLFYGNFWFEGYFH